MLSGEHMYLQFTSVSLRQCILTRKVPSGEAGPAHNVHSAMREGCPSSTGQESAGWRMVKVSLRLQVQFPGPSQHKPTDAQLASGPQTHVGDCRMRTQQHSVTGGTPIFSARQQPNPHLGAEGQKPRKQRTMMGV